MAFLSTIMLAVFCSRSANAVQPIETAAELYASAYSPIPHKGRPFHLVATVALPCCERRHRTMAIEDASGAMLVTLDKLSAPLTVRRGDRLELSGTIADDSFGHPCASCTSARLLPAGAPPTEPIRNPTDFSSDAYRCRVMEISGSVADAFTDEIDPNFMFIILNHDRHQITVATESDGRSIADCQGMIGRAITVLGVCRPSAYGVRTHLGPNLRTTPENIRIDSANRPEPFAAREIDEARSRRPSEVASPERHKVSGTVIAAWANGKALVRTPSGQLVRICVSHGDPPEPGQTVEAVGFPETDLYRINLTRCLWRPAVADVPEEPNVLSVTIRQLTSDSSGQRRFDTDYHGRRVRLTGRLLGFSPQEGSVEKALLESEGQHLPIYMSARHGLSGSIAPGSVIEVEGICVMDTESWSPYTFFPRIQEVLLSVSHPDRITVVAHPSWWTPTKFTVVSIGLMSVIFAIVLWNLTLKRVVNRKSRQLKREITARLASDLKKRERTRLAVDLHDSIAQTLSGTAMEIGSALRSAGNANPEMLAHLQTASQTLRSCRDDLRDCLWDLRSNALEATNMDDAIRTTLTPILGGVTTVIRFNVFRKRLSDNTAHALLRIIHELVSNAVRHGRAKVIRIAGSIDGSRILFSVRDDGCGFDTDSHPDAATGHFGLEGIRERIRRFNGTMDIDSTPAEGTKVTIALDVSLPEEEDLIET